MNIKLTGSNSALGVTELFDALLPGFNEDSLGNFDVHLSTTTAHPRLDAVRQVIMVVANKQNVKQLNKLNLSLKSVFKSNHKTHKQYCSNSSSLAAIPVPFA